VQPEEFHQNNNKKKKQLHYGVTSDQQQ